MQVKSTFFLTYSQPLPSNVLRYLRIQRLLPEEISATGVREGAQEKVNARNEVEVLEALINAFTSELGNFHIPLETLEAIDRTGNEKKWAAAQVSIGEQRILKRALQEAEEQLALVVCANCGKADINNKKCLGCKKVVYCNKECQRNHYKEKHKKMCKQQQH